jgi:uncharacterized protein (TIGR02246 family)
MTRTSDEEAVRALVDAFTAGWNAHDGTACARPFAPDADFTNIMGLTARDRETIARGHDEIFSTIFRSTRIASTTERVRFIKPDVAVVEVAFKLEGGELPFGLRRSSAGLVATKDGDSWSIVVFRNMVPFERPAAGPVERALTENASSRD